MVKVRRALAAPLWWLCWAFDSVPVWTRTDGWLRRGGWGCYLLRISRLAARVEGW